MKKALISAVLILGAGWLLIVITAPVSTSFLRYCWWRISSGITVTSGAALSRGSRINYQVFGEGKPVLLLHGGFSNRLCWFSQLPFLSACGYRLILVDSRGHGSSDLGEEELDYRLMAADALAVLDRLRIADTKIIGWSDGANTGLLLAALYPQRVEKVVAISGNFGPEGLTTEARAENSRLNSGLRYWLYRWWTGAGEKVEELERRLKKLWENGPGLPEDKLRRIQAPVLLIFGEKDLVTPSHARKMAELIPGSELDIVAGGGHATLMTHPDQVNGAIHRFLAAGCDKKF